MVLLGLDNLKGIREIGGAGHARQVTLGLRVERRPVRLILLLLGSRCRQIRDFIAFDDAQAGRHDEHGSERGVGPFGAACPWRSQFAVLRACQIPFRLGRPSAVRGAR